MPRIQMPRGGARSGAGRPRKDGLPIGSPPAKRIRKRKPGATRVKAKKKPDPVGVALGAEVVKGYTEPGGAQVADAPKDWPFGTKPDQPPEPEPPALPDGIDPATGLPVDPKLEPAFLLQRIAQNPLVDIRSRIQAATNAAPYFHAKKGEAGKKEEKDDAAKRAAKKFAPAAAPLKLVKPGA